VSAVWEFADGAVVGSAIVAEIERLNGDSDLLKHVGDFLRDLIPNRGKERGTSIRSTN
jgi:tryptophan synthase alpha subunit